jgi:hypothetical protein
MAVDGTIFTCKTFIKVLLAYPIDDYLFLSILILVLNTTSILLKIKY